MTGTDGIKVGWTGVEAGAGGGTHEHCQVREVASGVEVTGSIQGGIGECHYALRADRAWVFHRLDLRLGEQHLQVRREGGRWFVNGSEDPELADAREVDLSVSPLSNTLPIRRLGLEIGQSADIVTAYIDVPELTVVPDPQRYTRTGEREYLYESRDSDFSRTITVDEHGLVVEYPGLFTRARQP